MNRITIPSAVLAALLLGAGGGTPAYANDLPPCEEPSPGSPAEDLREALNRLWEADVRVCVGQFPQRSFQITGPDREIAGGTVHGGTILVPDERVYLDTRQLLGWPRYPAWTEWVYLGGHEWGHVVQCRWFDCRRRVANPLPFEDNADCLAGYALARIQFKGRNLLSAQIRALFFGLPSLGEAHPTHGGPLERAQWVRRGFKGAQDGLPPRSACP